jgi:hypothetical protein
MTEEPSRVRRLIAGVPPMSGSAPAKFIITSEKDTASSASESALRDEPARGSPEP